MEDPVKILIEPKDVILDGVKQFYVATDKYEEKLPTLIQILKNIPI